MAERRRQQQGPLSKPTRPLHYRCVCGQLVAMPAAGRFCCAGCGRSYDRDVAALDASQTLELPPTVAYQMGPAGGQEQGRRPTGLAAGQKLSHFRIVRRLGRGGMGAVYQAVDEALQRYVALKVIEARRPSPDDSGHWERLLQEARAQARVNHPHVVHIYYVGCERGVPFLAMELVPGPTLAHRLKDGPLPFAEVVRIGLQVVGALQQAARFDIVHGDIKPSNVLLAGRETAKLSDFGLARRLSEASGDGGRPRVVVGTPNYVAPEVADGRPCGIRSDMYSLGVTLFEMTFGRLPYNFASSTTVLERLRLHRYAPVEFPEPWPETVPQAWRAVLARLLAKLPQQRYDDYEELAAELRGLQPVTLPGAGRVVRAFAWLVDLGLARVCQELLYGPFAAPAAVAWLAGRPVLRLMAAATTAIVPLLGFCLQPRWGTTPGKKLFQLRIVDRHGLTPAKTTLALRCLAQLLPIWVVAAWYCCKAAGAGGLANLMVLAGAAAVVADAAWAIWDRRRRSLHDLLFGTQVVLDTRLAEQDSRQAGGDTGDSTASRPA